MRWLDDPDLPADFACRRRSILAGWLWSLRAAGTRRRYSLFLGPHAPSRERGSVATGGRSRPEGPPNSLPPNIRSHARGFISFLLLTLWFSAVHAHGVGPWGHVLDWHTDQIDQVIAATKAGEKISVDGKECVAGGILGFRVNDEYAFDIDETVWLDFDFYLDAAEAQLRLTYDGGTPSGSAWEGESKQIQLPSTGKDRWIRRSLALERARFANLGFEGTDFSIAPLNPGEPSADMPAHQFTICNVSLRRSYSTPVNEAFGAVSIEIFDAGGHITPARMGIYDRSGRLPLPSNEAVLLKNGVTGSSRVVNIGAKLPAWPMKNRTAFYSDGRYHTRLPVGDYDLIVSKGPEYRITRRRITVQENGQKKIEVRLERWKDMAAGGWYSGEDHIHYARNSSRDDYDLQLFTRAEDVRVANILQFGNSAKTYYDHYDWKHVIVNDHGRSFVLAPGQEDPRTSRIGHTTMLNIKSTLRDPDNYLLYHKIFEQAHAQGGLAGYAHVDDGWLNRMHNATRGLAIDVPFGIVDFAQILTFGQTGAAVWFDFLNLGYKISPTAGTDYPIDAVPGTYRNYVHMPQGFTPQAWFDGLRKGDTFVTSGPMLAFKINEQGMGSEIRLKRGEPLAIKAKASLNPDIDVLTSLELIEQGETVKSAKSDSGADAIKLSYNALAKHGTWFVLRARGKKNESVVALSAPIYVIVDGDNFWKRSAVQGIVAKMKVKMEEIFTQPEGDFTSEEGMQNEFVEHWHTEKDVLRERVNQAVAKYDQLLKRVQESAAP